MANVLRLAMGIVEFPEILSREEVLNRKQCENLLSNFQKGVEILHNITKGPTQVFREAEKDLLRIVNKGRVLIEECCNENWVDATVMQLSNKEWFRELLSDFKSCFHTLCEISCHYNPDEKETILAIKDDTTFYPTPTNEVEEDQASICGRLSKHLDSCNTKDCKDCRLVRYLEEYLRSLQDEEGGKLDNIVFPYNYPRPEYGAPPKILGRCNGGAVYLTDWCGVRCATKVIDIHNPEDKDQFWREASILGGLNHPNIIKFLCCGFHEVENQFELVMEFGETTLSQHLSAQGPLKEMDAMDIMLQIANGMCYLHDMKVAHRDLKPQNVVVTPQNDSQLDNLECVSVKLLDFGISKVEVKDSPEVPTGRNIGTHGYMAPEAMANELSKVAALKADVFSFGMMCSDILSGEKPRFGMLRDYREWIIHKSKRPKLRATYSEALRSLVHECWSLDPSKRPTFLDIYKRLAGLKTEMLKGSLEITRVTNDTTGCFWPFFSSCKIILKCMQWLRLVPQLHHIYNSTSISSVQTNTPTSSHLLIMEVRRSL
jgi:serine/threonine protein kinase